MWVVGVTWVMVGPCRLHCVGWGGHGGCIDEGGGLSGLWLGCYVGQVKLNKKTKNTSLVK